MTYIVEPQETHWTIGFGGGDSAGRFPSRREALESALRDAARVRCLGCGVDVLVRRRNGTIRKIPERIRIGGLARSVAWPV
jgi:hypothetical protein